MGNDVPLACLSNFSPIPYEYFKQLFAQVTNPPIDPFREKVVMSLHCPIGPEDNILQPSPKQVHRLWLKNPVISIADLDVLKQINHRDWSAHVIDITYPASEGVTGYINKLKSICEEADEASKKNQIIILSDRHAGSDRIPLSSLLALGIIIKLPKFYTFLKRAYFVCRCDSSSFNRDTFAYEGRVDCRNR